MRAESARIHVLAPPGETRKLVARFSRAGLPTAADDAGTLAEILVVTHATPERLQEVRPRVNLLVAVGAPSGPLYAAGADEVVAPGEPEALFRRVRLMSERVDLELRALRQREQLRVLESALADVAHDLRSPLHTARGHAELLVRDPKAREEDRDSARAIARQVDRALQVAEGIVEGARARDGLPLSLSPVNLATLIEEARSSFAQSARARNIEITASITGALGVRADPALLARLLDNLIANALGHSGTGGQVELSAHRSGPRGVRLCVRDTGKGMSSAQLSQSMLGLGPGRGLRICRDIAEKHGGELWAESAEGKGTRITVELPLSPPSARPRVLLVSENDRWLREVTHALGKACRVQKAALVDAPKVASKADLILVEAPGRKVPARQLDAVRTAALGAQVPLVELPASLAASRLASALVRLSG